MRHELIIHSNGCFAITRDEETGNYWSRKPPVFQLFGVEQKSEGTKVCRIEWKDGIRHVIPFPLKRKRYSLSCVTGIPACGYNFTDFQNDFWEAIEMEVQS